MKNNKKLFKLLIDLEKMMNTSVKNIGLLPDQFDMLADYLKSDYPVYPEKILYRGKVLKKLSEEYA